jgi:hypothetical protein
MTSVSQTDQEQLQAHSNSLINSAFVGVLVGHGSMILHFSDGSRVLVQCAFEVSDDKISHTGHGESAETSVLLFQLFNAHVVSIRVDTVGQMIFDFGAGRGIRRIPDGSGFESYVLSTPGGVFPVY